MYSVCKLIFSELYTDINFKIPQPPQDLTLENSILSYAQLYSSAEHIQLNIRKKIKRIITLMQ